jgi:hypothetical protein
LHCCAAQENKKVQELSGSATKKLSELFTGSA